MSRSYFHLFLKIKVKYESIYPCFLKFVIKKYFLFFNLKTVFLKTSLKKHNKMDSKCFKDVMVLKRVVLRK